MDLLFLFAGIFLAIKWLITRSFILPLENNSEDQSEITIHNHYTTNNVHNHLHVTREDLDSMVNT